MRCTEVCDPANNMCPEGFECRNAGGAGACWPGAAPQNPGTGEDGGGCGCAVGARDRGLPLAGFFLGFVAVVLAGRRRRR
jgi:MYXO-CTERM domain-containing protein